MSPEVSTAEELWRSEEVAIDNALHFADGRSFEVEIDPKSPTGMVVHEQFDLDERLSRAPDWTSVVDGLSVPVEGGDRIWHGDGDNGSEGFIARTRGDRSLQWVLFFTSSNPFIQAEVTGNRGVFQTSSGIILDIDIQDPTRGTPHIKQ